MQKQSNIKGTGTFLFFFSSPLTTELLEVPGTIEYVIMPGMGLRELESLLQSSCWEGTNTLSLLGTLVIPARGPQATWTVAEVQLSINITWTETGVSQVTSGLNEWL